MSEYSCKTCRHWKQAGNTWDDGSEHLDNWNEITMPVDPDTYQPMEMPFEVRQCRNPKLLFCERPLESDGYAVADGSQYMARLYTAEDFGCALHESVID